MRARGLLRLVALFWVTCACVLPVLAGPNDPPEAATPVTPAFPESTPSIKAGHAAVPKATEATVSNTGALIYAISFEVPPGRNGATPAPSLTYSSSRSNEPSAFGSGWRAALSSIERSIRYGTPRIRRNGTTYQYDDSDAPHPTFERDGAEILIDDTSQGATFVITYRDRIDRSATRSIYHSAAPSFWEVTTSVGTTSYYGGTPDGAVARAVVEDDLGVRQWLLVRTVDPFGNTIDYSYLTGPPRTDLSQLQLAPLPYRIDYGANLVTDLPHHARVEFTYTPWISASAPAQFLLDHAHGHVFLDRVLARVDVSLMRPQATPVRSYVFDIERSPSTGRPLLISMHEEAGGLSAPAQQFEYSRNDGTAPTLCTFCSTNHLGFTPSAELSRAPARSVFRLFGPVTGGPLKAVPWANVFVPPTDPGSVEPKWPAEFNDINLLHPTERFFSPPGIASAFQFRDLDGDGTTDILYHPTFLGGTGIEQPWMSFLQGPTGDLRTSLSAQFAGKPDPLSARSAATDYADVDGDGAVDRIRLMPGYQTSGSQPLSNPAYAGLCAWWFQHAGRYTDPVPDEMPIIVAGFIVDRAAASLGLRGAAWSAALGQTLQGLLHAGHSLPLDGGIPSGFANCYHWNASNPLSDPALSGYLDSGSPSGQFAGQLTIERGRLLNPDEPPAIVSSYLLRYPNIGYPDFFFNVKPQNQGNIITGAQSTRSVNSTLTDLDGDHTPEFVVLKSLTSPDTNETWGPGVWRIHDYQATHELDEATTATRFVSTLESIIFSKRQVGGFSIGDEIEKWQCPGSRGPLRGLPLVTALRREALLRIQNLDLPVDQRQTLAKFIDQLVTPRAPIDKWVADAGTIGVPVQRFLPEVDWVSTFLDVNGDGLPDLVISKGASCHDSSRSLAGFDLGPPDHAPGFDVFLNRGDRFETTPDSGQPFARGPFDIVRNWNAQGASGNLALLDKTRFPFSTLAFTDLDGDGVIDATLSALVIVLNGATSQWKFDGAACVIGAPVALNAGTFAADPGNAGSLDVSGAGTQKVLINCAWRGTGTGWTPAPTLAAQLPSDGGIQGAVIAWEPGKGLCEPVPMPCGSFNEKWTRTDLRRFADFDNDGLVDLITVRDVGPGRPPPEEDATRIYRNTGTKPDVLQAIDNSIGARTSILFEPAKRTEVTRAPMIPWIVRRIDRDPQIDGSDQITVQTTSYAYTGALYDYHEATFLGFKTITETRVHPEADHPGSAASPALVIEKDYLQADAPVGGVTNARSGVVRTERRYSSPEGLTESTQQTTDYEVVAVTTRTGVRLRKTKAESTTCKGMNCLSSSGARLQSTSSFSDFDDFDHPSLQTQTGMRTGYNDGFDGTISIEHRWIYLNNLDEWILGQPQTYQRTSGGQTLADESYQFLHNKLSKRTVARLNVDAACSVGATSFVIEARYNPDGTLLELSNNNDQIAGGARPRRGFLYDDDTHQYLRAQTDYYTRAGQPAMLTSVYSFDRRFGTIETITDPNGNSSKQLRDALGRPSVEFGPDGQMLRQYSYNWSIRPVTATTTDVPGRGQPSITTVEFMDGFGRSRQVETLAAGGAFVSKWQTYDSTGGVFEEAPPFKAATAGFLSRTGFAFPLGHHTNDVRGRTVVTKSADGRVTGSTFSPDATTAVDALGTPTRTYHDAFARVVAIEESFRAADTTGGFVPQSTQFILDADARVLAIIDADGAIRHFTHDERGNIVTAESAHGPNVASVPYRFCFDGRGQPLQSTTPAGIRVYDKRDELGRLLSRHYAAQSSDDETLEYDNPAVPNGLGHLTRSTNAHAIVDLGYDQRGNITQRTTRTTLGADASPFADGTYTESAEYDALDRIIGQNLPRDPAQIQTPMIMNYFYDDGGHPRQVHLGMAVLASVTDYSASGKPLHVELSNGLAEVYHYDPLNDRLTASEVRQGTSPAILSYALTYDDDDNPRVITRFLGAGVGATDTLQKVYAFDSLNRLQSATYSGLSPAPQSFAYSYSRAGAIQSKDGFTYSYQSADTQAITQRAGTAPTPTEHYAYDVDGNLRSATPSHDGQNWTFAWDGAGRLAATTRNPTSATPSVTLIRYGPEGSRLAKIRKRSGTTSADLYIGALELRVEGITGQRRAYEDISFGPVALQLALKPGASGLLEADPAATRFYHRDYLSSTLMVSNPSGTTTPVSGAAGRLDYGPYGETLLAEDGVEAIRKRYGSMELDAETDLTYYHARYADAQLGRFISRDSVTVTSLTPPQVDRYALAFDNPIKFADPNGHDAEDVVNRFKELTYRITGVANAFVSDAFGGAGRMHSDIPSYQEGQQAGDVLAVAASGFELRHAPAIATTLAAPLIPETSGGSLAAVVPMTGVVAAHAVVMGTTAAKNLLLSKGGGGGGRPRFSKETVRQSDAEATNANGDLICRYCSQKMTKEPGKPNSRHTDHIDPVKQGGTNSPDNAAAACRTCNCCKGGRTPDEWGEAMSR
ncbi:SpvB/TcaC N-terminal domain-containing protein [Bradyrhizobium sp. UFLA05-153]